MPSLPNTETRQHAAVQALLQFQAAVPVEGLPVLGADHLQAELDLFPVWCVQRAFGRAWGADEQALWARVSARLVDSAQAQPRIALRSGSPAADLGAVPEGPAVVAGPITGDIAALLRDDGVADDEAAELDLAVRLVGRCAPCRSAGGPGLRRVLARAGMDGPAAPADAAGPDLPRQGGGRCA